MVSLFEMFEIRQGQFINNKDTPDGQTTVIKNGSKQYKKNIKSNLSSKCIIITKMSIDILYIEDFENYYISSGGYILTLKEKYKDMFLKYLYYIIKYKLIDIIKNYRHGALQQAINKTNLEDIFKKFVIPLRNPIKYIIEHEEKYNKEILKKEQELKELKQKQKNFIGYNLQIYYK